MMPFLPLFTAYIATACATPRYVDAGAGAPTVVDGVEFEGDWRDASLLGLQRSVSVRKTRVQYPVARAKDVKLDGDWRDASLLGLQRSFSLRKAHVQHAAHGEEALPAQPAPSQSGMFMARGIRQTVQKGMPASGLSVDVEDASLRGEHAVVQNVSPVTASWMATSVLGLQRGFHLKRVRTATLADTD
jgi:hypothetical protein